MHLTLLDHTIARGDLSVCPSFCRILVFCPDVWRYDRAVFTALHVMQSRYGEEISVRLSVRLSVRPSVSHTHGLWQNGRKICPDLYTIRKNIYPSFLRRRMVGGGRPLLPEILGQPTPLERNRWFSTNNHS